MLPANEQESSMYTYEWLGVPSQSGIRPILDRSVNSHAKSVLKEKTPFPVGPTYGVRILNNDSVLVWAWDVSDG